MEPRISLVTLGVSDVAAARDFYRALGWEPGPGSTDEIVFIQAGSQVIGLWDRALLAADTAVEDGGGWGGITLAHNVRSPEDVDAVMAQAADAGARIARAPAATFWGGYSGVFHDLDGHAWEVAHNPGWELAADGSVTLSE